MKKRPNWPAYVSESNGRIVYRPRVKVAPEGYKIDSRGFLSPPEKLGKVGDRDEVIIRAYLKAKEAIEGSTENGYSLQAIAKKYQQSSKFKELSTNTQKDYANKLDVFLQYGIGADGIVTKLGLLLPKELSLPAINAIKEDLYKRAKDKGESGTSFVNGQIRVARAMMSWAENNIEGVTNPFRGIQLGKEKARERYVTDDEYETQYLAAVEHSPPYLPLVFEHAYLLACRSVEVCNLTIEDITEKGYIVRRTKGSKTNIVAWSERLEAARDSALMWREKAGCRNNVLIPSMRGNKLTKDTLQSAMQELKKHVQNAWNLHDLKRKGISDSENPDIGGHRSFAIMERYRVKLNSYNPPR